MSAAMPKIKTKLFSIATDALVEVGNFTKTKDRQFQDDLSDAGTGSLTAHINNPRMADLSRDGLDLIQFSIDTTPAWMMIVEKNNQKTVMPNGMSEQIAVLTGRGHLALTERSVVYPSPGVGRSPVQDNRTFNWTDPRFDDSGWDPAFVITSIAHAQSSALGGDNVWGGDDSLSWLAEEASDAVADGLSIAGPPDDTPILGPSDGTTTGVAADNGPMQNHFFRQLINIPASGKYSVHFLADNVGELYIDGVLIMSVADWKKDVWEFVDLAEGWHLVGVYLQNIPQAVGNPTGFSWNMWDLQYPASAVVARSDSSAVMLEYQDEAPGMTVGAIWEILLTEAHERGELLWLTINFDAVYDSYGLPWLVTPTYSTKVNTDYFTVIQELSETYADFWMPPDSLELQAYEHGTRGINSGVAWETGVNLTQLEHEEDYVLVNSALVRDGTGWSVFATGDTPVRGGALTLGANDNNAESARVTTEQLDKFGRTQEQIVPSLLPIVPEDVPYTGDVEGMGDTVTVKRAAGGVAVERVVSMTVTEDPSNFRAIFTPVVKDIILDLEVKGAAVSKKGLNGSLGGAAAAVYTPVIPRYMPYLRSAGHSDFSPPGEFTPGFDGDTFEGTQFFSDWVADLDQIDVGGSDPPGTFQSGGTYAGYWRQDLGGSLDSSYPAKYKLNLKVLHSWEGTMAIWVKVAPGTMYPQISMRLQNNHSSVTDFGRAQLFYYGTGSDLNAYSDSGGDYYCVGNMDPWNGGPVDFGGTVGYLQAAGWDDGNWHLVVVTWEKQAAWANPSLRRYYDNLNFGDNVYYINCTQKQKVYFDGALLHECDHQLTGWDGSDEQTPFSGSPLDLGPILLESATSGFGAGPYNGNPNPAEWRYRLDRQTGIDSIVKFFPNDVWDGASIGTIWDNSNPES